MLVATALFVSTVLAAPAPPLHTTEAAQSRGGRWGRWRARREEARGDSDGIDGAMDGRRGTPDERLAYGRDPQQRVELYRPTGLATAGARPPLAIFIHGGGWRHGDPSMVDNKPDWMRAHGWWLASVGYRLLPEALVETQLADAAAGIRAARANATRLGYDPDRILLFGHSAGAHIAAMLASDPRLLEADFAAIRGVILLDGAGYDVPQQMQGARFLRQRIYEPAFGSDPARQRALSPITYAAAPNVPDWLIVYSTQRRDSPAQSRGLGSALSAAGARVAYQPIDAGHMPINRDFGSADYAGNAAVEAIMRGVAGGR